MKKFLLGVLVLVFVLAVVGFLLPTHYTIDRSLTMKATPAQIRQWAGDLAKWREWAPWAMEGPSIVTTLGDRTTGVGASQTWTSDDGDGGLTLTASDPETGLAYDMAFLMGEARAPAKSVMSLQARGRRDPRDLDDGGRRRRLHAAGRRRVHEDPHGEGDRGDVRPRAGQP